MNKYEVTTGVYKYKMPHWKNWAFITIDKDISGQLQVRFSDKYYPAKLIEISENAIFIETVSRVS